MALANQVETIDSLEASVQSVESKGKSLYVTAVGLTTDFAPADVIKRDAWTFKGKEVRWRHKTPESDPKNLIGHIHDVYVENEKLKFIYEVWGYRDDLKQIQEMIEKNEVSISSGYRKIVDNAGVVVGFYGRELSVTPFPKCTKDMGCGNEAIIANEDNKINQRENNMPKEDNESISILREQIAKNEDIIKELKDTNGKLVTERGEQIVRLESTIEALETKVGDQNELIAEQIEENESLKEKVVELEAQLAQTRSLPLRMEIVTLEQITEEEAKKEELEELLQYNEDQLKKMKERLERAANIAQKTAPNRRSPALGESNQQNDLDNLSPEELTKRLNPQLQQFIEQNERASGKAPYSTNKKEDGTPMLN